MPERSLLTRHRPVSLGVAVLVLLAGATGPARAFEPDPVPDTEITRADTESGEILSEKGMAMFRYRSDQAGSGFTCSLDDGGWRSCQRGSFRRLVAPGRHVFRVRAVTASGLADPTPATWRWRVERWKPGMAAASRFAARRAGRVTFSLDLGWRSWGRVARSRARMASTVKVMLMVAYLRKRSVRSRLLSPGARSSISSMIRVSDNDAANWVSFQVGPRRMRALARRAGMKDFTYSTTWGASTSSPADQARFMKQLENLLPSRHRRFALRLLSHISGSQRWGIPRARPAGWKLFFKGGWGISDGRYGGTVNHQVAMIRRGRHRIGLAIFTQGNPYTAYGERTLRGIAGRLLRGLPAPRNPSR